jgi:NAD(P)-dependent dehydrogenase (short-subunit alcohol dehydrogenase family)
MACVTLPRRRGALIIGAPRQSPKNGLEDQASYSRFPAFSYGDPAPSIPSTTPSRRTVTPSENSNKSTTKIAIVTGASRGLGRNTALSLARRGVDVIITYHSNRTEAASAIAAIEVLGRKALALRLDSGQVSTFDGFVRDVGAALQDTWGSDRFDFLVNNAGTSHHAPFTETKEEDFDQLVNVHFKGVFFLTQKLLPLIRDEGRIVNISSGLARVALPGSSAYGAMKGAVEVLTRYMAKELPTHSR